VDGAANFSLTDAGRSIGLPIGSESGRSYRNPAFPCTERPAKNFDPAAPAIFPIGFERCSQEQ